MKKTNFKLSLVTVAVCLSSVLFSSAFAAGLYSESLKEWGDQATKVDGREYKFLVDPAKVDPDREKSFRQVWALTKEVFNQQGLQVKEKDKKNPFKPKRQDKIFYDTPNMDLWKKGYIIRATVKYEDGKPEPKMKTVVKRINAPFAVVNGAKLTRADGKNITELEDNVGVGYGGKLNSYVEKAISNKLTKEQYGDMTIGAFAKQFPVLSDIGLPADTKLVEYAGYGQRAKPGYVIIPGAPEPSEISMECWSEKEGAKPIVCDFTFGYEGEFRMLTQAHKNGEKALTNIYNKLNDKIGLPNAEQYGGSKVRTRFHQPLPKP